MNQPLPTKFCNSCHQTLPKESFKRQWKRNAKGEQRPNGWSQFCRPCTSFIQMEQQKFNRGDPTTYVGKRAIETSTIESSLRFATTTKNRKLLDELQDKIIALSVEDPENPCLTGTLIIALTLGHQNFSCALCRGPLPIKPRPDYWPGTKKLRGLLCVKCKNQVILFPQNNPAFLPQAIKYIAWPDPTPKTS